MSKYKSGPLPKMFKIIPSLPAWSRMLALTRPENWTPHACRAATRIFISNMKPPQAQLYLEVVLLDAIREDIQVNKKLNVQYYECLKRALYKPGAFFKAIIFPILDVRPSSAASNCCQLNIYQHNTVGLHIKRICDNCICLGKK
jgi:essential nuclear protein 1